MFTALRIHQTLTPKQLNVEEATQRSSFDSFFVSSQDENEADKNLIKMSSNSQFHYKRSSDADEGLDVAN